MTAPWAPGSGRRTVRTPTGPYASPGRVAVWFLLLVLTLLVLNLLTACGGLPTSSPVQQGLPVGARPAPPVRVVPVGPQPDSSPEQVVRGFLRAGAGLEDNDHSVARDFFVRESRQAWRPNGSVMVYQGEEALSFATEADGTVRAAAQLVAAIDEEGRYRQTRPGTKVEASFDLRRQNGEWRITSVPSEFGLWLTAADVDRLYSSFEITYVARSPEPVIVPDVRWFPVTSGLATTLARAQLTAVPGYLAGVVATGIPAGTRLEPDSVPVVAGRAQLNLSPAALAATAEQRKAMAAQFLHTLQQVPAVDRVVISVGGTPLDAAGPGGEVLGLEQLGYGVVQAPAASSVVVRAGAVLSRQDASTLASGDIAVRNPPAGPSLPAIPTGWVSLALSRDSKEIAAVGGDLAELARWRDGQLYRPARFGTDLTRPSYDGSGGLWVAGQSAGATRLWVLDTAQDPKRAVPRAVEAPWLRDRHVLAFRVARDGLRAVVMSTDAGGGDLQIGVAGIVRDDSGAAISVAAPLRVGQVLTAATDVTWADQTTLAVVGRGPATESLRPYLVRIGGQTTALSPVKGARSVTTLGGPRGLLVGTDAGALWLRVGSGWQDLGRASQVLLPGD